MWTYVIVANLLLLHHFPVLRGANISYETPPFTPVLRFLPWRFSLKSRSWCYPTTSASLSFFSPAPPSPSLSCLRIILLFFYLLSCTFLNISPTFVVPLIISFLILSSLVAPLIHLNILISATSNFFSCAFFTAQVSAPCIIAGVTSDKYCNFGEIYGVISCLDEKVFTIHKNILTR